MVEYRLICRIKENTMNNCMGQQFGNDRPLRLLRQGDADTATRPTGDTRQNVQDDPLSHLQLSKLQMPRLRARLVARPHLLLRLQQGMEHALTLVSAPAGFGKTTLLAQW